MRLSSVERSFEYDMIAQLRSEQEVKVTSFEITAIIAVLEKGVDCESRKHLDALFSVRRKPRAGTYDFREVEDSFSENNYLGGEFADPVSVLFFIGFLLEYSSQDPEFFSVWMSNMYPLISVPSILGKRFVFGYDLAEKKVSIRNIDPEDLIPSIYRPVLVLDQ